MGPLFDIVSLSSGQFDIGHSQTGKKAPHVLVIDDLCIQLADAISCFLVDLKLVNRW
jgi:hypothetical protein